MRLGAMLALLTASGAYASGFHEEAIKCLSGSDFQGLRALADKPLGSNGLDVALKVMPETAEAVDWSILLRRVTLKYINRMFGTGGEPFLTWLLNNPDAVADYVHGGADGEVCGRSLEVWRAIWEQCPESRVDGPWRRFAIASGLVQSQQVYAMADGKPIDPVARFKFFKQSADDGALAPCFFKEPIWQLRYVAGSWAMDSDLAWVRTAMKPEIRNQLLVGDACLMVPYIEKNHSGVSVQDGSKFYDDKPMTLKLMTEYGGVCGAIARFGASSCQALGVPAFPVGQPAHCAFVWENADSSWRLGNDVFGWGQSTQHPGTRMLFGDRPAFIELYDLARRDEKAFQYADRLTYAASLCAVKVPDLSAAVAADPLFLPAWRQLCALEPTRLSTAARVLGVSPYAVSDLYRYVLGDAYLDAIRGIAQADSGPQFGIQNWAALELVARRVREISLAKFIPAAVINCNDKHFKWSGTDDASQAVVAAAIKACGSRGDMTAQLAKLLKP